jgi:hypothetical protein
MQPRKPKISTKGLDVVNFSQLALIHNTPYADGLCGALSHIFITRRLTQKPIEDFKNHARSLYHEAVSVDDKFVAAERDGDLNDPDASVFSQHGLIAKSASVRPDELASHLQQDGAALLKYPTSSGAIHQLSFTQSHDKCELFEPNRFIASGSCPLVKKTMFKVIARSHPSVVKISTVTNKP